MHMTIINTSWHPPGNPASLSPEYGAAFRAWLDKPVGKHFVNLELQCLNSVLPTLYGYEALLIGEPNFAACMQQSTIKNQFIVNDDLNLPDSGNLSLMFARQDRLPIESATIDMVYVAHSLEFAANPHEVLREVYRILRADGHLVISMFNPLSLWGAWRGVAKLRSKVPWRANFMSIVKLKDWLALLGFDIMQVHYFGFNLPLNKQNYGSKLSLVERYGQKIELPFGAAYVIEASKRVIPLTPVMPAWRTQPGIIEDDVTEPTA